MKVYNLKEFLKETGHDVGNIPIVNICNYLDTIGITINPAGPWIAGGAMLKTLTGQPLTSDIDIFFSSEQSFNNAADKLLIHGDDIKSTSLSKTFKCSIKLDRQTDDYIIQLVKFIFKPRATEVIDTFDLSVCQIAFDGDRIVAPESSIEDILNKRCMINVDKITMPGSTLSRIVKYAVNGFKINDKNLQEFADRFMPREKEVKSLLSGY